MHVNFTMTMMAQRAKTMTRLVATGKFIIKNFPGCFVERFVAKYGTKYR
jgi:hypothetical protein